MNESLLIYKIDLVSNFATPKIEYLVYSQNKTQLDLKYCNDVKIFINSPINTQKLDDFELIKDLNKNGIDLYNQNDSFFNDRCNNQNINDSDIPLSLRRELFFQNNSLCEKNCQYEGIDLNNNKVKCNCDVKVETNFTVNEEKSINNFGDNVIGSINFDIIYCYEKLLNFDNYISNIGFYFGSGMLLSNICLNLINFFYSIKKIFFLLENLITTSNPIKNNNNITTIINDEKSSTRKLNNNHDLCNNKKIQNLINKNKLDDKISLIYNNNNLINKIKIKKDKIEKGKKEISYENMSYKDALIFDKRNFFLTFYYYLLRKIELLNLFFNRSVFESFFLLLSVYLLSLLMDFTMNSLLYSDDYMEKKYKNNGKLDFFSSFFLSFLSNIISFCIIWLINRLINYSLILELVYLEVKNAKNYYKLLSIIIPIIKKRLIIYIIINLIISIFCCYYLTIFCIIYKNSQYSLFINYLTGNITSLLIAIILSIIISLLRKISIYKYNKNYFIFQFI